MKILIKQNWTKKVFLVIVFTMVFNFSFINIVSIGFSSGQAGEKNFGKVVTKIERAEAFAQTADTEKQKTDEESVIARFLSWVTLGIANVLGKILTYLISLVVALFKWQDFNIDGVTTGWVAVRDICNMFFILILLMIAFSTILRLENYNIKKLLPKLLIIAVLINFSKTICLLLIDFSQVVMLTFVNAFAKSGAFVGLLHLDKIYNLKEDIGGITGVSDWDVFGAIFFGLIFILISFAVFVMFIAILLSRMIAFWILIVLSPLAFLAYAMPGGGYFSKWWGEFSKYLLVGPILAFFTWLSLIIIQGSSVAIDILSKQEANKGIDPAASGMAEWGITTTFLLGVAMLIGGIKITQSLGAAGGNIGMNMVNGMKNRGMGLARKGVDLAKAGAVGAGLAVGRAGLGVTMGTAKSLDNYLGKKAGMKQGGLVGNIYGSIRNAPGNITKGVKQMVAGNSEVNEALHGYYFDKKRDPKNAKLKWGGYDDWKEDGKGNFSRTQINPDTKKESIIYADHKDKKLSSWGDERASLYEGFSSANSGAKAAANKAQEEKINEYKKKISDSNLTAVEKHQRLSSNASSATEKMALAIDLAENGDFKTHDDVETAREAIGDNPLLIKKFNDEVDKHQAHLGYDLSTNSGMEDFKNRVDAGKIDTTKLDSDAYKDKRVIKILQEYHGKDFGRVMESAFKRGKKYETAVTDGLAEHANTEGLLKDGDINPVRKALAKLTGDIGQALRGLDLNDAGVKAEAIEAIGSMLQGFSTKDLAKLSVDNFDPEKMKKHFGDNIDKAEIAVQIVRAGVSNGINQSTLLSISKQSDVSKKLIDKLKEYVVKQEDKDVKTKKDKADKETESIIKEYSKYSKI